MAENVIISEEKAIGKSALARYHAGVKELLATKVDKIEGMGLSTNDFTNDLKTKLEGIEAGATKTVVEDSLTSDSTTAALSAAQGKALDAKIDALEDSIGEAGYGDMLKTTYDADNDGKVDNAKHAETATQADNATLAADAEKFGGQLPAYYAAKTDIPTKVSALTNDAEYITAAAIPTNVSAFENDAKYLVAADIADKLDKTGDGSNVTVTFTEAAERVNVTTGDTLTTLMGKISKWFSGLKTVAFTGKYEDLTGLPTISNDLTDELKAQYDAAYEHSQEDHAPADAEKNVVVGVQVNGTDLTVSADRKVNVVVPTTVAELTDAADYAKKADIATAYIYKGSVANEAALPTTGMEVGHVYNIEETGMNVAWNGTAWDNLGTVFSIEYISNDEIDEILAS